MTKLIQESTILAFAAAEPETTGVNPYLRTCKFVFADDQPNANKQQIPYEEFAALAASAIGMPIKMRFLGRRAGTGSHDGSIPIGHIQKITEDVDNDVHRLIAEGVLYADEYPDYVEYLEEAHASGDAPGISWELSFRESVIEKGIMLLKGVIARAATFVKHPAYGKRTALLALASDASLSDDEMEKEVVSLFAGTEEPKPKGGTDDVTLEEAQAEIERLKKIVEDKTAEAATLADKDAKIEELETALAERDETIKAWNKASLIADRTNKAAEAGITLETDATKLTETQELWAAMSEEVFNHLLTTVKAVASKVPEPPKKAEAGLKLPVIPRISPDTSGGGSTSIPDLRGKFKTFRNDDYSDNTEE